MHEALQPLPRRGGPPSYVRRGAGAGGRCRWFGRGLPATHSVNANSRFAWALSSRLTVVRQRRQDFSRGDTCVSHSPQPGLAHRLELRYSSCQDVGRGGGKRACIHTRGNAVRRGGGGGLCVVAKVVVVVVVGCETLPG